jgi:hypothetical protein
MKAIGALQRIASDRSLARHGIESYVYTLNVLRSALWTLEHTACFLPLVGLIGIITSLPSDSVGTNPDFSKPCLSKSVLIVSFLFEQPAIDQHIRF